MSAITGNSRLLSFLHIPILLVSVVDPDPVGSETFGRIRIRKNFFRIWIRLAPYPDLGRSGSEMNEKLIKFTFSKQNAQFKQNPIFKKSYLKNPLKSLKLEKI